MWYEFSFPFVRGRTFIDEMMNVSDSMLLNQYVRDESQSAFNELVVRHADWVYSAAVRLVRDAHLAEDVTQAVFLLLAQNAGKLGNRPVNAWLFKVTRYCAANALRAAERRRRHERTAAMLKSDFLDANVPSIWGQMAPLLEESINHLRAADREVLLLRFYQRKSMADIGAALGVSEDAAKKRVSKTVERLRSIMSGKGVLIPAAVVTLLSEQTTYAAPAGLATCCVPGAATAGAAEIAKGVHKMLFLSKLKLFISAVLILTAIPLGLWIAFHAAGSDQSISPNQTAGPMPAVASAGPVVVQPPSFTADDAAIAPFCNSQTQVIFSLNFSDIDPDALADAQQRVLLDFADPNDTAGRELIMTNADTTRIELKRLIDSLAQAGCQSEYLLAMQRGENPDNIDGMSAFPIGPQTNIMLLDELFGHNGMHALDSPDGHARLYAAKPDSQQVMDLANEPSVLLDALSASGYGAVRIAFHPAVLKFSGPVHTMMGLGDLSESQWNSVNWGSITLFPPPNSSATIILQCRNADSAAALVKLIGDKFAALQSATPTLAIGENPSWRQAVEQIAARLAPLLAQVKPAVIGSRVIVTLDKSTTEMLLAIWYLNTIESREQDVRD